MPRAGEADGPVGTPLTRPTNVRTEPSGPDLSARRLMMDVFNLDETVIDH